MKNFYRSFLLFSIVFCASRSSSQTVYPYCVDGTIYMKTHDTSSVQLVPYNNDIPQLNRLIIKYGITDIRHAFHTPDISLQHIYRVNFTQIEKVDSLITDLQQAGFTEFSEKVDMHYISFTPNDFASSLWHLEKIEAPSAWDITTGSPSVVIAIVDNAVKISHPDLAGNIWTNPGEIAGNGIDDDLNGYTDDVNGYDVADDDNNPSPPLGTTMSSPFNHGTHCAGIASAATNNDIGIASIGFKVKIMSVKCSPNSSQGSALTSSYEGIDYAMTAGANIISMSFGSTNAPFTGQLIVNAARARGIVMIAAAGNAGSSNNHYPAAYNYVIGVGATTQNDQKAGFSNYGSYIDVMAPGVGIYSTIAANSSYGYLSGTSMACPLVAGLAGLVLTKNSELSPNNIEMLLEAGCENIYPLNPGFTNQLGAGRINARNTLSIVPVSVNEHLSHSAFTVAPNPNNGYFYVTLQKSEANESIRIINTLGQVMYETPVTSTVMEINHNFNQNGLYLIEIMKNDQVSGRTKVVIGR